MRLRTYFHTGGLWKERRRPVFGILLASAVLVSTFVTASVVGGEASAVITPTLTVSPGAAVPNQTVTLSGAGFTPASTPGGAGYFDGHQITGMGASKIFIDGIPLSPPHVSYPITFDYGGLWSTIITIPAMPEISAGSTITIEAVDDQGLTLSTQLSIKPLSISVFPSSSSRNSEIRITGEGFPISTISANALVSISYAGLPLGTVSPNPSGEIDLTMRVPMSAFMDFDNTVRATRVGFMYQYATAIHSVPTASITVSPTNDAPGSMVIISGKNFPALSAVTSAKLGIVPVLEGPVHYTDKDGKFVATVMIPMFAPGVQEISATAGDITAFSGFTVTEGPTVIQPTPAPAPIITSAQAMKELTEKNNLIRLWNFDNTTKQWTFFDPREAFADANTLKNMVTGSVYWLRVNSVQSIVLNGNPVTLYEGWNLVPW